ncbi:MAG TPA: MFS transporter, partial [Verrucomicrobiae bacterium]|nr:MFS transporter [Verrucomicrobiae bacterium]
MEDPEISVESSVAPHQKKSASYAVFKNRDFLVYLIGRAVASLGQQMLVVAVDWELYDRTHSTLALGLVGLSQMIPMILCTLPAGHLADNFNRKKIILAMTLALAVASVGLTLVSAYAAPVAWTYACLMVTGAARTFLWPASAAFLPHLVPRSQFAQAVTFNSGVFQMSSVAGPALSGAVIALMLRHYAHPAAWVYGFNAFASLVCFGMVLLIRREHIVTERQRMSLSNLGAGFKFVFENKIILGTITLDLFAVLLGGATSLLPVFSRDILHSGPDGLGFLRAAMPFGAVLCALVLAHRGPMHKAGRAMLVSV